MPPRADLVNILCMFDEGLCKIIKHLEASNSDKAYMRAVDMHKAIDKMKNHYLAQIHCEIEKKI